MTMRQGAWLLWIDIFLWPACRLCGPSGESPSRGPGLDIDRLLNDAKSEDVKAAYLKDTSDTVFALSYSNGRLW